MTSSPFRQGILSTTCNSNGTCTAEDFALAEAWLKLFIYKNASADVSNLTHEDFDRVAHLSMQMYDSVIGTKDPDLSAFRKRGGKLVSYHGGVSKQFRSRDFFFASF